MTAVGPTRSTRSLYGLIALVCLSALPICARADVLEISPDGEVATYSGPSVYSSEGVRGIATVRALPPRTAPSDVIRAIAFAADKHAVSANLIEAVAWQESRLRHKAVSSKGAVGVMQLMDGTARGLGVDRYDLLQNVSGGAAYLNQMLVRYDGNIAFALAAYNAGPGAVDRYRGVPPYPETQAYVAAILGRLAETAQQAVPFVATADY